VDSILNDIVDRSARNVSGIGQRRELVDGVAQRGCAAPRTDV
jgi:hypothetical protein